MAEVIIFVLWFEGWIMAMAFLYPELKKPRKGWWVFSAFWPVTMFAVVWAAFKRSKADG